MFPISPMNFLMNNETIQLRNQLNEEKMKNQKLIEENQNLKQYIANLQNINNHLNQNINLLQNMLNLKNNNFLNNN